LLFVFAALAVTGVAIWFYLPSDVQSPEELVNVMATGAGSPPEPGIHGVGGPVEANCSGTMIRYGSDASSPPARMGCNAIYYPTNLIFAFDTSDGELTPNINVTSISLSTSSQTYDGPHFVKNIAGSSLPNPNIFTATVTQQISFRHARSWGGVQSVSDNFRLGYWTSFYAPSPPVAPVDRSAFIDCNETRSVNVIVESGNSTVVFGCRSYKRGATVTWNITSNAGPVEIEQLDKWMKTGDTTYSDKEFKIKGRSMSPDGHWQPLQLEKTNVKHSNSSTAFEIEFKAKADSPDNGIQYGFFGTIKPNK